MNRVKLYCSRNEQHYHPIMIENQIVIKMYWLLDLTKKISSNNLVAK